MPVDFSEASQPFREDTVVPALLQVSIADAAGMRAELAAGLLAPQAFVAPKYFYDPLGSKLFEAICELPEYYPTRTEAAIMARHLDDIAAAAGTGVTLIDLGAGNCAKAERLFGALRPRQYVPVDISVDFLRDAVNALAQRHPGVEMLGIGADFSVALDLPEAVRAEQRLFFYPGSSIGNFRPQEARAFLAGLRGQCTPGQDGLLIGIDLVKERDILDAAYDDALGVTAAFNLNLLRHVNRILGADFRLRDWRHRAFFNETDSRIEMHLEARRSVAVHWEGGARRFEEGERIHTENSYKYTPGAIERLLADAGFRLAHRWTDERGWFAVCHAIAC